MKVKALNGVEVEVSPDEIKRHAEAMGMTSGKMGYAWATEEVIKNARHELQKMTEDDPEDLEEMFEFAAKHHLFGNRTDTYIMCNFLKLFYGYMQQKTHK